MRTVTWLGGPRDGTEVSIEDDAARTVSIIRPRTPLSFEKPDVPEVATTTHHYPLRQSTDGRWWVVWRE